MENQICEFNFSPYFSAINLFFSNSLTVLPNQIRIQMTKSNKLTLAFNMLILIKLTVLVFIFSAALFLGSCEGRSCADGMVLDKSTNQPLDSVNVTINNDYNYIYTDSTGKFNLCTKMNSCMPKCKDATVTFSKSGYQTIVLVNPPSDHKVFMEK